MNFKNVHCIIVPLSLLMFTACFDSENGGNPSDPPVSTAASYGAFRIQLIPENKDAGDPAYSQIGGAIYDGPSPPNIIFKEVMSSGPCKLMKAINPDCPSNCGLGYKCVADDSCMAEPKKIKVGQVTITGFKVKNQLTPVVMDSTKGNYQVVGVTLDYPPCSEGDTIKISASGSESAAAFTLKVKGILPLEVPEGEILSEDGKPITLQWTPPKIQGVSTISVRINISYHGGTKGEIQCECEDNGSLTIPGAMLDQLKSFGMAGFPIVEITRKSVGYDENAKALAIVECTATRLLSIPGIVSCNQNEDCPNQNCVDRRCQ